MSNDLIKFFTYLGCNCVSMLLFYIFLAKITEKRRITLLMAVSWIAIVTIHSLVNIASIPPLNLVTNIAAMFLGAFCVFGCTVKNSILYTGYFSGMGMIAECIVVVVNYLMFNNTDLTAQMNGIWFIFMNAINSLSYMVVFIITSAMVLKKKKIELKLYEVLMAVFVMTMEMFILIHYMYLVEDRADSAVLLLIVLGFIVINLYYITAMQKSSESNTVRLENGLLQKQNEIQLAHYLELEKNYTESRKVIHDIKKHLTILAELKSEDSTKAEQYRRMIENDVDSLAGGFVCTNKILAIVMGQKIAVAEAEGIEVDTNIEDIGFDFMNDLDITAIFANLWDNAIEACVQCARGHISVTVEQRNNFVLINFKNNHSGNIKKSADRYKSTKDDHSGVGLTIVSSTVEKYGGILNIESDNSEFIVEITLPIPVRK